MIYWYFLTVLMEDILRDFKTIWENGKLLRKIISDETNSLSRWTEEYPKVQWLLAV